MTSRVCARGQCDQGAQLLLVGVGVQHLDAGLARVDQRVPHPGERLAGVAFVAEQQPPTGGPLGVLPPAVARLNGVSGRHADVVGEEGWSPDDRDTRGHELDAQGKR